MFTKKIILLLLLFLLIINFILHRWFHGDIEASEAEQFLTGKKPGTFLIRFSSQPGFFAGSYVDQQGKVQKCLIASNPAYYIADQEGSQVN